eukprot:TRINITY_DN1568_c0_g1_i2.p1 TRINITY_DN1568_c0_g1~~TRINITY_DN1568_c0_g1_i2.p1  ORF type:complete len:354 (-),score=51.91 TRINITY_DN1568_c0_g1_i2:844-1815(-)
MADWEEGAHACFIALVFAFMLAKLLSLLGAFYSENYRIQRTRCSEDPEVSLVAGLPLSTTGYNVLAAHADLSDVDVYDEADDNDGDSCDSEANPDLVGADYCSGNDAALEAKSKVVIQGESTEDKGTHITERVTLPVETERPVEDDSDDWEGVESTELEEEFGAASIFVATMAASSSLKMSQDVQLQLYGLYKLATEGPCRAPQPSLINVTARAKWNAWQKLGNTSQEEAMVRYIYLLSNISPSWNTGTQRCEGIYGSTLQQSGGRSAKHSGVGGPVFSSFMSEEGSGEAGSFEAIHACAKRGDRVGLLRLLEQGETVDQKGS